MQAFVINLDQAEDRWAHMAQALAVTEVPLARVPAVDGHALQLPHADYAEHRYRLFHGRSTNPGEIGCYFSHLEAWTAFLAGPGTHALICEDDLQFVEGFQRILRGALKYADDWDILRLSGLRTTSGQEIRRLPTGHRLCVSLTRLKGAGAYLISRKAAERMGKALLPMRLPFDHAIDREWVYGLRAAVLLPFPVSQTGTRFRTSIQRGSARRLGWRHRFFGTYPYQALNELSRYVARGWQMICRRPAPVG